MEFISVYGLFLAKVATVVLAIAALAILAVSLGQRKSRQKGELQLTDPVSSIAKCSAICAWRVWILPSKRFG